MKKILFSLLALTLLSGCGSIKTTFLSLSNVVDYQKYHEQGFFITEANSVSFEYDPIGSVLVTMRPGYEVTKSARGYLSYSKNPRMITEYDVLDELKKEVETLGGNGVINIKVLYETSRIEASAWDASVLKQGTTITVTGMAIKRK